MHLIALLTPLNVRNTDPWERSSLKMIANVTEGQCEATRHAPEFFRYFQIAAIVEGLVVLRKTASLVAMQANAECYGGAEVSCGNFTERQWPPLRL